MVASAIMRVPVSVEVYPVSSTTYQGSFSSRLVPCPRLKWTALVSFCFEKRTSSVDSHSVLSRRTKFLARRFSPGQGSGVT